MTTLFAYPAVVQSDSIGRVCVSFNGLPGATWGDTTDEALEHAKDLLATAIEMLLEDGDSVPLPPPANGRPIVEEFYRASPAIVGSAAKGVL